MKSTMRNMLVSLTTIAAVVGGVLAGVNQLTMNPIAESKLKAKTEALGAVLPEFDNSPLSTAKEVTMDGEQAPVTVYTATKGSDVSGYAVESWTKDGFSGEIKVMVGFDIEGRVSGFQVIEHAETPGLGAKANDWFRDPTGHRSIIGTDHPLTVSKDGGEIDGITAATITSRAFLDAVNAQEKP